MGPVAFWDFEEPVQLKIVGTAELKLSRLSTPVYPFFPDGNRVLNLTAPARVVIPDPGGNSKYDFQNGDAVTFEAWVRVDQMRDNMYLIGKGRTELRGPHSVDQNWAFRLRKNPKGLGVNFLFRSANSKNQKGDWHRWTSESGFAAGTRWHHVALKYRFGDPDSIVAFIDGKLSKGTWDMGGPTSRQPVVNNEDIWIGSSMAGNVGNSLTGGIDGLKIHRRLLSDAQLGARYQFDPPDTTPKNIPTDQVLVQMLPASTVTKFDDQVEPPLMEWHQPEFAFNQLPLRYDDWGIREDPGAALLIRAWSMVTLPAGSYKILIRGRGLSRLTIGKSNIAELGPMKRKSGAHNHVIPLPETAQPNMRPHAMNEQEQIVEFQSDGTAQRWRFETVVGGSGRRAEFGETCVAVSSGESVFQIVSWEAQLPLTDDGWMRFQSAHDDLISSVNFENRSKANAKKKSFWDRRHRLAKRRLVVGAETSSIDSVVLKSVVEWNEKVDKEPTTHEDVSVFQSTIGPMLQSACGRCHGQKENGGLSVFNRQQLLNGGESGIPAVVPGNPEDSYLFELISASQDEGRMPPLGNGLNDDQIAIVRDWILDGAHMPGRAVRSVATATDVVDDLTFLRRVYLDTVGVIPTMAEIRWYEGLAPSNRRKTLVDRLLNDDRWADNWVGYWQDVLAENPNLLKPTLNNTGPFRYWIHEALQDNKPLDRFATELMLMRGSTWNGGTAGFAIASQNDSPMAAKAHVVGSAFLGINLKCARCHDAPYHQHTQADLFHMAAMLKRQPISLPESSTVPAAFFEKQTRLPLIQATLTAGDVVPPEFPFIALLGSESDTDVRASQDVREQLALSVTGSRRFAEVMANRIWARLMGAGLVEPVDDWEANPASNPELLQLLADQLIQSDFDCKQFVRRILLSRVYQGQVVSRDGSGPRLFVAPYRRRMTAEQVVDSALVAAGRTMSTELLTMDSEGLQSGDRFLNFGFPKRAWELTTLANERDRPSLALPHAQCIVDVLTAFGWRDSRPEPLTCREDAANVSQPGTLANGSFGILVTGISGDSRLVSFLENSKNADQLATDFYLTFLTRRPTNAERTALAELLESGFDDRVIPSEDRIALDGRQRHRYVSWSNHLHSDANVIKAQIQKEVRAGPIPTNHFKKEWRERAEDAIWVLLNSPEMVMVP